VEAEAEAEVGAREEAARAKEEGGKGMVAQVA